jgi:pimeloyl-ACP methyl ester carboxylesterase
MSLFFNMARGAGLFSMEIDAAMRHDRRLRQQGPAIGARETAGPACGTGRALVWLVVVAGVCCDAILAPSLHANDAYYRTLLPEILPPTPAPTGQPGLYDKLLGRYRVGRPQRMVIMADKPRQAAMAAMRDPGVGVTLAGYALSAGVDAERANIAACVDLYFETVAFSWNFLKSRGASARPEYETAWQLYHNGLARLMGAGQRFGRLDPSKGLRVVTATGSLMIPTTYRGFAWQAEDFSRVEVVNSAAPRKLQHHYSNPGLGVPLVVIRDRQQSERFFNNLTPFGATVVLRPSLAVLAGTAPPIGAESSHGPLEFYDPLRVSTVAVGQQQIAMATNTSAALEYMLRGTRYSAWEGLVQPGSADVGQEKLFLLEPRQPGKYPLVFVHGFFSSPAIWADIANEILAQPGLRNCYQLIAYRYPTGRPFVESAAVLRREINALVKTYDSEEQDPSMYNMAMIGHSMGGLVAKLTVTRSDDRLWYAIANRPLSDINVSDAGRQRLAEWFYFEPLPFVRRVVFLGAPHDGSMMAGRTLGRVSSRCVQYPTADLIEHDLLVKQNPGVFSPEFEDRIPTSIDMMERSSGLLQAIQGLCPGQYVQFHNIIGTQGLSPLEGCGDGVVSVESAQYPFVSTEKRVHTTHGGLYKDDDSVQEILCILQRHILEANDEPCTDESGRAIPEGAEPEQSEPCPTLAVPDACVEVPETTDPCDDESSMYLPYDDAEHTTLKPPVAPNLTEDNPADPLELDGPELVCPSGL